VRVVSKYDGVRTVLRTLDVFSSSKEILLNDAKVRRRRTRPMTEYPLGLLSRKWAKPESDLLRTLAAAKLDNAGLSEASILGLSITTLVAGNETTRSHLAVAMWALANHPQQAELLAADALLSKQAVEVVLRWLPTTGAARSTTRDAEIGG
jgi:cytochrome P450